MRRSVSAAVLGCREGSLGRPQGMSRRRTQLRFSLRTRAVAQFRATQAQPHAHVGRARRAVMRPELRVPVFFMPIRGCGTLFGAERLFEQDHVAQQDALLDDRVVVIAGKKVGDAACGAEAALRIEAERRGRFARADPQRAVASRSIAAGGEGDPSPAPQTAGRTPAAGGRVRRRGFSVRSSRRPRR